MKRSHFTSEQIVFALRQAEPWTPVIEVCRKMGIVEQTFYRWKKKYSRLIAVSIEVKHSFCSCGNSLEGIFLFIFLAFISEVSF